MKAIFIKKKHIYFLMILILLIISTATVISYATSSSSSTYSFAELYDEYMNQDTKVLSEEKLENIKNIYKSEEKVAYLTFDDGPTKRCTPKILDILKENNIPATFFVIGERVEQNPEIVKRAYEEGHFIANHTYSHKNNQIYQSKESFLEELLKTDKAISNAISVENYHSHLFRFPCGSMTDYSKKKKYISYLQDFDYTYLDWNCLNNDGIKKYSDYQLLSNLKKTAKNKDTLVVLMHDSGDLNKTYEVLQDSIDYLKNQGYEFKSMKDFMED